MKKLKIIALTISILLCNTTFTNAQGPKVHPLKWCFYSTHSSEIFTITYDNLTHLSYGMNTTIWIKTNSGVVYGPISTTNIVQDPAGMGWKYTYDLNAQGINLPQPLQSCYQYVYHQDPNPIIDPELEPQLWYWPDICECNSTNCDADFTFTQFSFINLAATLMPWSYSQHPNYIYTTDWGDGTVTSPLPVSYVYSSPGAYTVCLTVDNGTSVCQECIDICINDNGTGGSGGTGGGGPAGKPGRNGSTNINDSWHKDSKNISLYPVPADNVLNIDYNITTDEIITISVRDMQGKEVINIQKKSKAGKNTLKLPTNNFTQGVYIINLQSGDKVVTEQFSIMK